MPPTQVTSDGQVLAGISGTKNYHVVLAQPSGAYVTWFVPAGLGISSIEDWNALPAEVLANLGTAVIFMPDRFTVSGGTYTYNGPGYVPSSGVNLFNTLTNPPTLTAVEGGYAATVAYYEFGGNTYDGTLVTGGIGAFFLDEEGGGGGGGGGGEDETTTTITEDDTVVTATGENNYHVALVSGEGAYLTMLFPRELGNTDSEITAGLALPEGFTVDLIMRNVFVAKGSEVDFYYNANVPRFYGVELADGLTSPPTVDWSSENASYLASMAYFAYQGHTYSDLPAGGSGATWYNTSSDGPPVIYEEETRIAGLDGVHDVNLALAVYRFGVDGPTVPFGYLALNTVFNDESSFIAAIPSVPGSDVGAVVGIILGVFKAQGPGKDYQFNPDALSQVEGAVLSEGAAEPILRYAGGIQYDTTLLSVTVDGDTFTSTSTGTPGVFWVQDYNIVEFSSNQQHSTVAQAMAAGNPSFFTSEEGTGAPVTEDEVQKWLDSTTEAFDSVAGSGMATGAGFNSLGED